MGDFGLTTEEGKEFLGKLKAGHGGLESITLSIIWE